MTQAPVKVKNTDPEVLRKRLLNPFPEITVNGMVYFLIAVLILSWSLSAVGPSETNRITSFWDPFQAMGNLLGRMLPPEFEFDRSRTFEWQIFGREYSWTIESREVTVGDNTFTIGWLPVVSAIFETIQMAIIGTLGAVVMAVPLSLLAARNTAPHPIIYQSIRLLLNLMRSIPELVYALLFVAGVGLGAFTGVLALAFGSVGSLSRIFAESIEQIDPAQVNAVRATGASDIQTFIFSVLPQVFPLFITYTIIFFESNVRHATILGYVGAGGVGFLLFKYTGTSDYDKVFGTVVVLVIAVTVIDRFSSWLRRQFI